MKKISLLSLFFILGIFAFSTLSYAATIGVPDLEINVLSAGPISKSSAITGKYTITNKEDNSISGAYVILALIQQRSDTQSLDVILEKRSDVFEMLPKQKIDKNFTIDFPATTPEGIYLISLRLYAQSGVIIDNKYTDSAFSYKPETNTDDQDQNFLLTDPQKDYVIKNNKQFTLNQVQEFDPSEKVQFKFYIKNNGNNPQIAVPDLQIFPRIDSPGVKPIIQKKLDLITINSQEEKNIVLDIPSLKDPNTYLAIVQMRNQKGDPISVSERFRWVVAGINGKIVGIKGMGIMPTIRGYDLSFKVDLVGPASSKNKLENANLNFKLYGIDSNKLISENTKPINSIDQNGVSDVIKISTWQLTSARSEYRVVINLTSKDGKILDTLDSKIKFLPVKSSWTYFLKFIFALFILYVAIRYILYRIKRKRFIYN